MVFHKTRDEVLNPMLQPLPPPPPPNLTGTLFPPKPKCLTKISLQAYTCASPSYRTLARLSVMRFSSSVRLGASIRAVLALVALCLPVSLAASQVGWNDF